MKKRRIGFGAFDDDEDNQDEVSYEPTADDDEALKWFTDNYTAVAAFKDADEFMTTDEIYRLMSSYIGGLRGGLGYKELTRMLKDEGYARAQLDGGKFVWLLKKTPPKNFTHIQEEPQ